MAKLEYDWELREASVAIIVGLVVLFVPLLAGAVYLLCL